MYFVNGRQVDIVQKWRTRCGLEVEILELYSEEFTYPIVAEDIDGDVFRFSPCGVSSLGETYNCDLISLVKDVAPEQKKPSGLYVNGHQVKVGQVWSTLSACNVTITRIEDEECSYPIEARGAPPDFDVFSFTKDGAYYAGEVSTLDLVYPVEEVQPTVGQKFDQGKLRPTLLFQSLPSAVHQTIEVLQYGANKYGDENWKQVDPKRYKDALLRHLLAYLAGEEHDKESDLKHLAHISSNVLFLLEHEAMQDKEKN